MRLFYICLSFCCALMLTACSSFAPPSPAAPPLSPALSQRCPPLTDPAGPTGADLLRWGVATAEAYNACRARHGALVDAMTR